MRGRIINNIGHPVANATISLSPDEHQVMSNENGEFEFKKLYAGLYFIKITSVGHEPYQAEIKVPLAGVLAISMVASMEMLSEVEVASKSLLAPDNLIKATSSAMPVTVISKEAIAKMGSRRLDEVLKEQTGITIVNNIAGGSRSVGVQMQGFGSEYVMVLIDGQPMLGRNNGSLDLSRISVSNIERIEIIKGASSCLYGSEALGGAINVITRYGAVQPQASVNYQYGSLNISDLTIDGEMPFSESRGYLNLSGNFYHSDGFNTNPNYILSGTTAPPYNNYNLQGRAKLQLSKNSTVGMSGRYGLRRSVMEKDFGLGVASGDTQDESEVNLSANFNKRLGEKSEMVSRYYFTSFKSDISASWLHNGVQLVKDQFVQRLQRIEQQFSYQPSAGISLVAGLGYGLEKMSGSDLASPDAVHTGFAFLQSGWQATSDLNVNVSARYDQTSSFGGRLNPALGLRYQISDRFSAKAGIGTGFKAPDFKNRFLVFYNPVANYLVVGNQVLRETITALQAQGEISQVRSYLYQQLAGQLKAEQNTSWNLGGEWQSDANFRLEGGLFYHQLNNQINAIQVATGSGNRPIYTYQNLPRAVNKGAEVSISLNLSASMQLSAGYQYLISKDLSVADSIRRGNFPYNQNIHDPRTGTSYPPDPAAYFGIENRSRHMANFKVFYELRKLDLSFNSRFSYRSRFAFGDANGNGFIDRFDTFAQGYFLWNTAIEKRMLKDHLSLRLTADNILNYTDMLIPGQPGRVVLLGLNFRIYKS